MARVPPTKRFYTGATAWLSEDTQAARIPAEADFLTATHFGRGPLDAGRARRGLLAAAGIDAGSGGANGVSQLQARRLAALMTDEQAFGAAWAPLVDSAIVHTRTAQADALLQPGKFRWCIRREYERNVPLLRDRRSGPGALTQTQILMRVGLLWRALQQAMELLAARNQQPGGFTEAAVPAMLQYFQRYKDKARIHADDAVLLTSEPFLTMLAQTRDDADGWASGAGAEEAFQQLMEHIAQQEEEEASAADEAEASDQGEDSSDDDDDDDDEAAAAAEASQGSTVASRIQRNRRAAAQRATASLRGRGKRGRGGPGGSLRGGGMPAATTHVALPGSMCRDFLQQCRVHPDGSRSNGKSSMAEAFTCEDIAKLCWTQDSQAASLAGGGTPTQTIWPDEAWMRATEAAAGLAPPVPGASA